MLELVIVTQLLHSVGMQPLSQLLPVSRQLNDCDKVFSSALPTLPHGLIIFPLTEQKAYPLGSKYLRSNRQFCLRVRLPSNLVKPPAYRVIILRCANLIYPC